MRFKCVSIEKHLTAEPNKYGHKIKFIPVSSDVNVTLHCGNTSFRDGFEIHSYDVEYASAFTLGYIYNFTLTPETDGVHML